MRNSININTEINTNNRHFKIQEQHTYIFCIHKYHILFNTIYDTIYRNYELNKIHVFINFNSCF